MNMDVRWLAGVSMVTLLALVGCGRGRPGRTGQQQQPERRCTVWLRGAVLPGETFGELARLGVDEVVLDAGSADLGAGVPVIRARAHPGGIPAGIPFGVVVHVKHPPDTGIAHLAKPLWAGLKGAWPEIVHAHELVLDLPRVPEGTAELVTGLAGAAHMPVVPILSQVQITSRSGQHVAKAAGRCIVLLAGNLGSFRQGLNVSNTGFAEQLQPLVDTGVRPRAGIVLTPAVSPDPGVWPDDVEPLSHPGQADLSTPQDFDWAFRLKRALTWSGKSFKRGDTIKASWLDAAMLNADLHELTNMSLPAIGGWDLIGIPSKKTAMGIGLDTLKAYLKGEGPEPRIDVTVERSGRRIRVTLINKSPFHSTPSSFGNWVEMSTADGLLAASRKGSFDRMMLGRIQKGAWEPVSGGADAVRFFDTYVAPGETARSGWVTLASRRSPVRISWQVLLSTGELVSGHRVTSGR